MNMGLLRKIINRIGQMTDLAWTILHGALIVSAAMLASAAVLYMASLPPSRDTYFVYKCAEEMFSMPPAVLLVGILGSVIAEDIIIRRGR